MKERQGFKSSLGMIFAAAGSAIGVGNIWRFPYITGKYGGAAFIIVYLFMIAIIGLPLLLTEFTLGRAGGEDASKSFKVLAPDKKWHLSGLIGISASFIILGYYSVVAGWTLKYVVITAKGAFIGQDPKQIADIFSEFVSSGLSPILYAVAIIILTVLIVSKGVQKGIEKAAKILLPILLVIMIFLSIKSLSLSGAREGVEFLLKPDFNLFFKSKDGLLVAMGHGFYSLSLGMGIMMTYGSYMSKDENLYSTAIKISFMDTIIAILAGLVIFPAVFSFGLEPGEGAGLVFITLPNIFQQMPGGNLFGILFFILLAFAALTSTISLLEAQVAFMIDSKGFKRKNATILVGLGTLILAVISSLSMGPDLGWFTIFGKNFFDLFDYLTANVLLFISAILEVIFLGWVFKKERFIKAITNDGRINSKTSKLLFFVIKYILPVFLVILFLANNLLN